MKIVSWNVNGIRAAWSHGLSDFLNRKDADIYAFQETKVSEPQPMAEMEGYRAYWSCCRGKKGYSGTMCLTRIEPVSMTECMGDGDFDDEGRVLTLEFENLFFINCYMPNSQGSKERYDYRCEWDERFWRYVQNLGKPAIICGDFNVAVTDREIYPENKWVRINAEGFMASERENLHRLIASGFTDSYRYIHPEEEGKYSWWSNRRQKRKENKGWRLDYFLVADSLKGSIRDSTMLTDIYGSDHCPLLLDMELDVGKCAITKNRQKKFRAQKNIGRRNTAVYSVKQEDLASIWENIDWEETEGNLARMQECLAKAAYTKDEVKIKEWQKRIVYSLDAKLLAVRHVCSANGGAGVDGVRWKTPQEKMMAAVSLTSKGYRAMPSKLLLIKSKNGKQRRIHIETYFDRAMQTLYAFSLDPVAESWGDRKSFAFRRGRSAYDLNEYIRIAFEGEGKPEIAFIGDVRQCYEHISHEWIRENIPLAPKVLGEFLNAGYVFAGELYPMDSGVGIGLSLSPIIANMVLDGLEKHIFERLYGENEADYDNGNLIRYADDIIVAVRSVKEAERVKEIVADYLAVRGLALSDSKSRIENISNGFDFMSRFYVKKEGQIYIFPSQYAVARFKNRLKDTIENHTGSQKSLIMKINRKLDGWASYHKVEDAQDAFRHIDVYVKALLLELCERKHPKWGREKILEKYWFCNADGRYGYALEDKKEVQVKFLSDTILIRHQKVKTNVNPYIDREYVEWREQTREVRNVTGVCHKIWLRQGGRCYYCGRHILRDQEKNLVEIDSRRRKKAARLAYVHLRCMDGSVDYLDSDTLPDTADDLMPLLEHLHSGTRSAGQKFLLLSEYFRTSTKPSISLTFQEIEDIMGAPLGKSQMDKAYWYRTGFMNISQSWLDNGYEIKRLHLDKKYIVFHKTEKKVDGIRIPEAILAQRIPEEAKYELENYFKHIIDKYGL